MVHRAVERGVEGAFAWALASKVGPLPLAFSDFHDNIFGIKCEKVFIGGRAEAHYIQALDDPDGSIRFNLV